MDLVDEPLAEAGPGPDVEAMYLPDWAKGAVLSSFPGKIVGVRRVFEPGGELEMKPTLRAALEVGGVGTIEIADDGPFFESKFRVAGDSKLIRARPGFRPIIALERAKSPETTSPDVFLDLGDKTLVFDSVDLLVDLSELPRTVTSLILCRGGSLTLNNCTITIISNRPHTVISLIRAGSSEKPSKIRLERTCIRGALASLIELTKGPAEVVVNRSVVLNGQGSIVSGEHATGTGRRVFVVRSVLASVGSTFYMSDPVPTISPMPLQVRAFETTFAHFPAPGRTSFFASTGSNGAPAELLNWQGDFNMFTGWGGWLSKSSETVVPISRIEDARTVWPGTDLNSKTSFTEWPLGAGADTLAPRNFVNLAKDRAAVFTRIPTPPAYLREKTMARFPRPEVPGLTLGGSAASRPVGTASRQAQTFSGTISSPTDQSNATSSNVAKPVLRELNFDAEAGNCNGDLGGFLAESIRKDDALVRILVRGSAPHTWSPVRLPDGMSLEILVDPSPTGLMPSWSAPRSCQADALLEVRGGNLSLRGVQITRERSPGLKHLIRVESGHLLMTRCRLTSPGIAEAGGGGIVAFAAPGSKSLDLSTTIGGPFETLPDRPTCRIDESVLITGGDVLSAEVGRGLVAFSQCAIASGRTAFSLHPARVARDRFESDLVLDHCTVASETNVVALGPWPGMAPGPDRPWLVSTDSCAFFGTYERPYRDRERETVMLRTDPDAFASGVLYWQSRGDVFEVTRFTAASESFSRSNARADLHRHWIELWGDAHFRSSTGPRIQPSPPAAKLVDRLQPGKVSAGDLALDPDYPPPGHRAGDLGVDLTRLGSTPSSKPGKKR